MHRLPILALLIITLLSSCEYSFKINRKQTTYCTVTLINGEKSIVSNVEIGKSYTIPSNLSANGKYLIYLLDSNGNKHKAGDSITVNSDITITADYRKLYSIGEEGEAGIVFYDIDSDNDSGDEDGLDSYSLGWRYLEVAKEDASSNAAFAMMGNAYNTEKDIGTGFANTNKLVGKGSYNGTSPEPDALNAADIAKSYNGGNKSDWFLPSILELETIYKNLYLTYKDEFSSEYISSTEYTKDAYYYWRFQDGITINNYTDRYNTKPVRAIRIITD